MLILVEEVITLMVVQTIRMMLQEFAQASMILIGASRIEGISQIVKLVNMFFRNRLLN